jgi:hypothetical protein
MKVTGALFPQRGRKAGRNASRLGAFFRGDEFLSRERLRFGFDGFGGGVRQLRLSIRGLRGFGDGFCELRQRNRAACLVIQIRGRVLFEEGSFFLLPKFPRRCFLDRKPTRTGMSAP